MNQRLNTIRGHLLDAAVRWNKAQEKARNAERDLVDSVNRLSAADPEIDGFDLVAALKSAEKHEKRTRGKRYG